MVHFEKNWSSKEPWKENGRKGIYILLCARRLCGMNDNFPLASKHTSGYEIMNILLKFDI